MKNFNGPFCVKLLVSVTKKAKKKEKKDCDPTISAVTNIHTRFYIQIREYPSTRILAAALAELSQKVSLSCLKSFAELSKKTVAELFCHRVVLFP